MIIEKVFSNVEEPSENLYSVLMTTEEIQTLYSDIALQKEFGLFNAIRQVGKKAAAGASKKFNMALAGKSEGVLHDNLTGKLLNKAVSAEGRQIAAQNALNAEKFGFGRKIVTAKQGVLGAANAVKTGTTSGINAVKSGIQSGVNAVKTGATNAYQGTVNAATQAARNTQAAGIHARRGFGDRLMRWGQNMRG